MSPCKHACMEFIWGPYGAILDLFSHMIPYVLQELKKKSVTCLLLGITLEAKIDKTSPLSQ